MASHSLKYSKLNNLIDIDCIFVNLKKNEWESYRCQISEESLQNKERVLSQYSQSKKEYLMRIKVEKEIAVLLQQQTFVSQKITGLQKKLQLLKEEKENNDKREVQRKLVAFEQNLGLRIETASNVPILKEEFAVSFVFHNVNKNGPQETCSFDLIITKDNKYKAFKCYPPVAGMDELILKLNKTNDLHQFVVAIRKEFCKSFSK